ncbi:MAG: hypothetical protein QM536_05665, partial [Chitinophagaceae bacterium]|nr:hypothetical protein [Chitinophagaceae bacterium]
FGGSGSELVLCKKLKRNFISCELHPEYFEMIQDRLQNNGVISDEYRLEFIKQKNVVESKNGQPTLLNLLD